MKTFIVGGGTCKKEFIEKTIGQISSEDRHIIACDRGASVLLDLGVRPDFIIGDFDSAAEDTYDRANALGIEIKRLNPIKDDTDAEAAINWALNNTEGDIIFLGATGTRLDHVLGNIALLGKGIDLGRRIYLMDETNKVYMIGRCSRVTIKKDSQYGKYVSVIPYMGNVEGLTMTGFKYPLENYTATGFNTLTISNEIVEAEGIIEIEDGYLVVLESID